MSSSKPGSPAKSPQKKKKEVTRYGLVSQNQPAFAKEERFSWQKAAFTSDTVYDVKPIRPNTGIVFGTANRKPLNEAGSKSSTGPGSYDFTKCYDHNSEYGSTWAGRFSVAARESMAVKTPSPGAVYKLGKCYWNGPDRSQPIGFPCSTRKPLYEGSSCADADMFMPKSDTGNGITMAGRPKAKKLEQPTPGAVYDVHKYVNFKTGPAFSFGKGKGSRFKQIDFLPERDEW